MPPYDRRTSTPPLRASTGGSQGGHVNRARLAAWVVDGLESGSVVLTAGAGYGKTTILDQALGAQPWAVARVSCSDAERDPEVLLMRVLEAISRAAPGAADALAERLAFPAERVDALAAVRELLADLARLLVDPVVLVIEDAEHLEGADGSLRLLDELIKSEVAPLRVAVAGRRALGLRVAKVRAAGRLHELDASDLAFGAEECAESLRPVIGREPAPDEVEALMEATEGWPLGIALAVGGVDPANPLGFRELRSGPDLRAFLSEELLESLDPDLREGAISSSVARVVTPEVAAALDLPPEFGERLEHAGMLVRPAGEPGAFVYHPLLRGFLLECLESERPEEARRALHGAVARVVAAEGEPIEAIEHWIEARDWAEAVAAIEREGPILIRTAPGLMRRWLAELPPDSRALPTVRSLEGQLAWLGGDNATAIDALSDAIRGFAAQPSPAADWVARSILVDSLFATGDIEALDEVVRGWDGPEAEPAGGLAPAAAMYAAAVLAAYARFGESDALAAAARSHPESGILGPLDALRMAFAMAPSGKLDEVLAALDAADRELQAFDPLNRRGHLLGAEAFVLADRGQPEDALRMWVEIRRIARGGMAPVLADASHAWCALLHAQAGRAAEADAELAQHEAMETGYRAYIAELAPAVAASLRGDAQAAVEHAEEALGMVAGGPITFRLAAAADLVPALVAVRRPERAAEILEQTLAEVDELLPGDRGALFRARLLALRAWMHHGEGSLDLADADVRALFSSPADGLRFTLRRDWRRLRDVVWDALDREALPAGEAVEALAAAFPDGLALVGFLEHPSPDVRREVLEPATESGDPAALEHLRRLSEDEDDQLAGAASRAADRLARTLPPLRFELLGDFEVGRGSWRAGDVWGRPVDARLVRFLLVERDGLVPEDVIFEALWPKLSPDNARKSLQVAASRARRILDPPGAERSVIESLDRSYRIVLGERDTVDAEEFRSAAEAASGEHGERRRQLLEHARSLWGGEPLGEERYSDWAAAYRERLLDAYAAVLAGLVEIHEAAGEHQKAAEVARELVDLDPLNEGGHRALIAAYARAGRRGQALRQYLECRRALVDGLGIEPSEATSRLQARILAGQSV